MWLHQSHSLIRQALDSYSCFVCLHEMQINFPAMASVIVVHWLQITILSCFPRRFHFPIEIGLFLINAFQRLNARIFSIFKQEVCPNHSNMALPQLKIALLSKHDENNKNSNGPKKEIIQISIYCVTYGHVLHAIDVF